MIFLLDLNYTLVSNSNDKCKPFSQQIVQEQYRMDLVDALRNHKTILITARPSRYTHETIESIRAKAMWEPHLWFFNDHNLPPADAKRVALQRHIFPLYGADGSKYFGIESNPATRAMYKSLGIDSCRYEEFMNSEVANVARNSKPVDF